MIPLKRSRSSVPKSFKQPALTTKAHDVLDIYYAAPNGPYDFKSSSWKPAKARLKKESFGKCAYCEAPTDLVAHGDVEHFRPKDIYWWLALCYDNYLYSCQVCNQSFKGNKFPVIGAPLEPPVIPPVKPAGAQLDALVALLVMDATILTDAAITGLWQGEDADLPNPYFEDPAPLFSYEPDDINEEVWVRSGGTARGDRAAAAANECLGINRDELKRERYVNYKSMLAFKLILDENPPQAVKIIALTELRLMQRDKEPFAGMRRFFARQWGLPGPA